MNLLMGILKCPICDGEGGHALAACVNLGTLQGASGALTQPCRTCGGAGLIGPAHEVQQAHTCFKCCEVKKAAILGGFQEPCSCNKAWSRDCKRR